MMDLRTHTMLHCLGGMLTLCRYHAGAPPHPPAASGAFGPSGPPPGPWAGGCLGHLAFCVHGLLASRNQV
eukprot:4711516-Pyramimonas_sp.AAC.1